MERSKLSARSGRFLIYFLIVSFVVISSLFGIYYLFLGQAFADRGLSENVLPTVFTSGANIPDMKQFNDRFLCSSKDKVVDLPPFSVGMFPNFLNNTKNTCNKSVEFIGIERFLDAFLYGESGVATPATAKSKETPFLTHHPGLYRLRKLVAENSVLDRSNAFFWWMFPLPIATPSRGFTYALFWGDFLELQKASSRRGLDFVSLFAEGIRVLLLLNGAKEPGTAQAIHSFNEQDHVFVKAYMSLQCAKVYTKDPRLGETESSLKSFLNTHKIRYPTDYTCS